jgi:hypothetical protein
MIGQQRVIVTNADFTRLVRVRMNHGLVFSSRVWFKGRDREKDRPLTVS